MSPKHQGCALCKAPAPDEVLTSILDRTGKGSIAVVPGVPQGRGREPARLRQPEGEAVSGGWIGVDLDGTLARYDGWVSPTHIGAPVPAMVRRVKLLLEAGAEVRIFTARVFFEWPDEIDGVDDEIGRAALERRREAEAAEDAIRGWCLEHLGRELPVTCRKDYSMIELWDDRCRRILHNEGTFCEGCSPYLPGDKEP